MAARWPIADESGAPLYEDAADPQWLSLAAERDRVVDRIGNLTLVTSSFNGSVSNLGWDVKKPEFEKQKSLVINYDIAHSDTWDEAHISARADALATVAVAIWPSAADLSTTPSGGHESS